MLGAWDRGKTIAEYKAAPAAPNSMWNDSVGCPEAQMVWMAAPDHGCRFEGREVAVRMEQSREGFIQEVAPPSLSPNVGTVNLIHWGFLSLQDSIM